jgi:V-type H+-transporting ATPase subunit F
VRIFTYFQSIETRRTDIEEAFRSFASRKDIGIILINQHICDTIRHAVKEHTDAGNTIPTVLEIPSVDHPYDPSKDSIMQRVQVFFGGNVAA